MRNSNLNACKLFPSFSFSIFMKHATNKTIHVKLDSVCEMHVMNEFQYFNTSPISLSKSKCFNSKHPSYHAKKCRKQSNEWDFNALLSHSVDWLLTVCVVCVHLFQIVASVQYFNMWMTGRETNLQTYSTSSVVRQRRESFVFSRAALLGFTHTVQYNWDII